MIALHFSPIIINERKQKKRTLNRPKGIWGWPGCSKTIFGESTPLQMYSTSFTVHKQWVSFVLFTLPFDNMLRTKLSDCHCHPLFCAVAIMNDPHACCFLRFCFCSVWGWSHTYPCPLLWLILVTPRLSLKAIPSTVLILLMVDHLFSVGPPRLHFSPSLTPIHLQEAGVFHI